MNHPTAIIENTVNRAALVGAYCLIGLPGENKATFPATPFGVLLDTDCILTGLVTVDSGTIRDTYIGKRAFLMKGVHVGHDAIIEDDVTISCHALIGGHVRIGRGANIGLGAIIHPRQVIPPFALIGAGAVVTKTEDIKPFGIFVGNPARFLRFNHQAIEKFNLSESEVAQIQNDWLNENQHQKNHPPS